MKKYIFLLALFLNIKASAAAEEKCMMLRSEIHNAFTSPNFNSRYLNEHNLIECFSAKMIATNNYRGGSMNHYDVFMDNLHESTTDIIQIMTISDQVDASLSQINGSLEESRLLVNTINVLQFSVFGKKIFAVVCGFGDDDHYQTTLFIADNNNIFLMGS